MEAENVDFINLDCETSLDGSESPENIVEKLSEGNIVPKRGKFLGLDIGMNSTGVCMYINGEKTVANISLTKESDEIECSKNRSYKRVLLRRCLKSDLSELVRGVDFDVIVIEDVFVGENPRDARLLFSLNDAIDEMILDGVCSCEKFVRVENSRWKRWLWENVDTDGRFKGLNDKARIGECLKKMGISESGKGFQDRLDATGMLIGYFIENMKGVPEKRVKVNWSDIEVAYDIDDSFIFSENGWLCDLKVKKLRDFKPTKKAIIETVERGPLDVFITDEPVLIGFLGKILNLDYIDEGGYLAFWVKKRSRKKFERCLYDCE